MRLHSQNVVLDDVTMPWVGSLYMSFMMYILFLCISCIQGNRSETIGQARWTRWVQLWNAELILCQTTRSGHQFESEQFSQTGNPDQMEVSYRLHYITMQCENAVYQTLLHSTCLWDPCDIFYLAVLCIAIITVIHIAMGIDVAPLHCVMQSFTMHWRVCNPIQWVWEMFTVIDVYWTAH